MTIRLSTGLRNAITAQRAVVNNIVQGAATMELNINDPSADTITDSGNGFGGFSVHDNITLSGCTTSANDTSYEITAVAAGTITLSVGSLDTDEQVLATTILASSRGGSISDLFRNGYLQVYTGTQPTDPDAAATGSLLGTYSLDAETFSAGTETYGLNFDAVSEGVMAKDADETWQTVAAASGTAGWFRFMSNASTPSGTTSSEIRFDGNIATSGANLNMPVTSFVLGTTYTIDTFTITFPAV